MPGVTETIAHRTPRGTIYRQDMLSGTQFHVRTTNSHGRPRARYFATLRGAIGWLNKQGREKTREEAR